MKHQFEVAEWGDTAMAAYSDGMHNGPRCTVCGTAFCVHCHPERMNEHCPARTPGRVIEVAIGLHDGPRTGADAPRANCMT